MPSPTRPLRRSPPRRPLHERSESEANERSSPNSRPSGDLESSVFRHTPYPTRHSHVLSPKNASKFGLGPKVFEDEQGATSRGNNASEIAYDLPGLQDKKQRGSLVLQDVENDYGASVRPLSIGNPVPIAVPPLNFNPPTHPTRSSGRMEEHVDEEDRSSDEIVRLPSFSTLPQLHDLLVPASTPRDVATQQPVVAKSSDASLSSSESTGTIIRHKVRPRRGSYSAFPPVARPSSSKSGSSPSTSQQAFLSSSDDGVSVSPLSTSSATNPTPEVRQAEPMSILRPHRLVSDIVNIQYPVVRQPSASGSWAETSNNPQDAVIPRPQRKMERTQDRWNPHLSTVPSEFTEERSSDGIHVPSSTGMSMTSLEVSQPAVPQQQRDLTGSTIRMVNESDDNVSNLLSPIPGSRGSAFYSVLSGGSRSKRRSVGQPRPTSKGSFFRDSIPAWAKWYYARSNSALALTGGRQDANPSASSESLGVRRTRPKQNVNIQSPADRDSMAIELAQPSGNVLAEVRAEPRQTVSQIWSPHLWQDRRSIGRRRSVFRAPSLDQHAEGPFGRRNVQVLLFTIGFIFPLAWFIASVLPLPQNPFTDTKESVAKANLSHDLEKTLGMVDEARYENARWWRNLNRLMCIVGVLIIAAIIALAVVAVRMRN
ncbi:MAG: hypothetical protein Q9201_005560 [Fulgogasparrea decipioides]